MFTCCTSLHVVATPLIVDVDYNACSSAVFSPRHQSLALLLHCRVASLASWRSDSKNLASWKTSWPLTKRSCPLASSLASWNWFGLQSGLVKIFNKKYQFYIENHFYKQNKIGTIFSIFFPPCKLWSRNTTKCCQIQKVCMRTERHFFSKISSITSIFLEIYCI